MGSVNLSRLGMWCVVVLTCVAFRSVLYNCQPFVIALYIYSSPWSWCIPVKTHVRSDKIMIKFDSRNCWWIVFFETSEYLFSVSEFTIESLLNVVVGYLILKVDFFHVFWWLAQKVLWGILSLECIIIRWKSISYKNGRSFLCDICTHL